MSSTEPYVPPVLPVFLVSGSIVGINFRMNRYLSDPGSSDKNAPKGEGLEGSSGHRGSLRGANKLARRARSFKDDLLERISAMRSPGPPHHQPHLSSGYRSHSPLSPKMRSAGAKPSGDEGEITPTKELEQLVHKVRFGLNHFCDVITKKKLEMLPGNSNIVLDDIANIHRAIKPYCTRSASLGAAVARLCAALAALIRLCDEATGAAGGATAAPAPEHAAAVVEGVRAAVAEVSALALQQMARPALSPRPALVAHRRPPSQRNSLPDIPLTPKERSLLAGGGAGGAEGAPGGVRASHSSESVLDAPDPPPPKPPRPIRKVGQAPPLPPKRKPIDQSLAISTDRVSLQSHSSGSLDSMLNVSHDDEVRAIMDHSSAADDSYNAPPSGDILAVCSCSSEGRTSLDSSGASDVHAPHAHTNHNRFSNESGFVSMNQNSTVWSDGGTMCTKNSELTLYNSNSVFESAETMHTEVRSFERRLNMASATSFASLQPNGACGGRPTVSVSSADSVEDSVDGAPPALPAKTRRNLRADLQQCFPNIEIRQTSACALHGEPRPHTLADSARPPPLPLKKKHMFQSVAYSVMAYMEMFGNCSHPTAAPPAVAGELFRHSIHTYNLASNNVHATGSLSAGGVQLSYQHAQHKSIAQSHTLHHFSSPPLLGSSVEAVNAGPAPPPPPPPALPPKMSKAKQGVPLLDALPSVVEPRPLSHNSIASHNSVMSHNSVTSHSSVMSHSSVVSHNSVVSHDSVASRGSVASQNSDSSHEEPHTNNVIISEYTGGGGAPGKFPLEEVLEQLVQLPPSPTPSKVESVGCAGAEEAGEAAAGEEDIMLLTDVAAWLLHKAPEEDGADVRGGHPDALIVYATKTTKDFAYPEAFLATYRTWVSPQALVCKLVRRARHLRARPRDLRPTLALFTRVVADLTTADLDEPMLQEIMQFVYWLVCSEELPMAKELRQKLLDKQRSLQALAGNVWEGYGPYGGTVSLKRETLLDFKASELAEQMTLLDAALFTRITTAEVLSWPRDQSEDTSPNLTRFTEHFNKMSYWARTRILQQEEARERERYVSRLLKVMKHLRKINNFNSYLALLSALDSAPIRRLGWPRALVDSVRDHSALIDSTSSFRYYRQVLADTHPPCIPYLGLVLQDLTFVHIGNSDLLPDGSINFSKRWQQYQIIENMKKFYMGQYTFKKNEGIIAMFNGFDDVLSEEAMWQISESLKPRGGARAAPAAPPPALVPTA